MTNIPIRPVVGVAAAGLTAVAAGHAIGSWMDKPEPVSRSSNMYTPKAELLIAVGILGATIGGIAGAFVPMARHWHGALPAAELGWFALGGALAGGGGLAALMNANAREVLPD